MNTWDFLDPRSLFHEPDARKRWQRFWQITIARRREKKLRILLSLQGGSL